MMRRRKEAIAMRRRQASFHARPHARQIGSATKTNIS